MYTLVCLFCVFYLLLCVCVLCCCFGAVGLIRAGAVYWDASGMAKGSLLPWEGDGD